MLAQCWTDADPTLIQNTLGQYISITWFIVSSGPTVLSDIIHWKVNQIKYMKATGSTFLSADYRVHKLWAGRLATAEKHFQQTRNITIEPLLVWCWASVADGVPTSNQYIGSMSGVCWVTTSKQIRELENISVLTKHGNVFFVTSAYI